jgi:hypothetical protein
LYSEISFVLDLFIFYVDLVDRKILKVHCFSIFPISNKWINLGSFYADLAWYFHDYSWCKYIKSAFLSFIEWFMYGFICSYKIMRLHGILNISSKELNLLLSYFLFAKLFIELI